MLARMAPPYLPVTPNRQPALSQTDLSSGQRSLPGCFSPTMGFPLSSRSSSPASGFGDPFSAEHKDGKCTDDTITVNQNVIHNTNSLRYMRAIDSFQELGIGSEIELPRVVVAGAQSVGKSSVLESLTGLPLSTASKVSTHFPVEIALVRDEEQLRVKASIQLDPNMQDLSPIDLKRLKIFNEKEGWNNLPEKVEFDNMLMDASSIIGVLSPIVSNDPFVCEPTVAKIATHMLKIELRGPDFQNLSIIDTPGLYNDPTESESDLAYAIERLVVSLITEKRTIIVAVTEASQLPESQKIISLAMDVDKLGERTVGILTKPDLAKDDKVFHDIKETKRTANNEIKTLNYGWYTVMNRSDESAATGTSLKATKELESELFAAKRWRYLDIPSSRLGIDALQDGLSNVYRDHIRKELYTFLEQARDVLKTKTDQLHTLGLPRTNRTEYESYLKSIVVAYQPYKDACLSGTSCQSDNEGPLRLLLRLANHRNEDLRERLLTDGVLYEFQTITVDYDLEADVAASQVDETTKHIYTWINTRYQTVRPYHIPGSLPQTLLLELFREQTKKWTAITIEFVRQVGDTFKAAVRKCIESVCANGTVAAALWTILDEKIEAKLSSLHGKCMDLIQNERQSISVNFGEGLFIDSIHEAKTFRFIAAIARAECDFKTSNDENFEVRKTNHDCLEKTWVRRMLVINGYLLKASIGDPRQVVYDLHDIMRIYYQFSLSHYTEAVAKNALTTQFMEETMDVFSLSFLENLTDMEIREIARENSADRKRRRELTESICRLESRISHAEAILAVDFEDE